MPALNYEIVSELYISLSFQPSLEIQLSPTLPDLSGCFVNGVC